MKTSKLPKGAKLLTPFRRKIGGWVEQDFDASIERFGITWFRVKGGFGGRGDREDWVADIPSGCLSVSDYHWTKSACASHFYGSFNAAITGETKAQLLHQRQSLAETERNLADLKASIKLMEATLKQP